MQFETVGQRLTRLRTAARLSQVEVARRVGVSQGTYSYWEHDQRAVPPGAHEPLARALGVTPAELQVVAVPARDRGRPTLPKLLTLAACRDLASLPVTGGIDDVCEISDLACDVVTSARRHLSPGALAAFLDTCPRDSRWELYIMLHLISLGAYPDRISLVSQRCPLLAVETYRSLRLAVQQPRFVLVLDRGDLLIVVTPQVWVVSPLQSEWYRLDFLCAVYDARGNARFSDLEFDTGDHDDELDRRRARGICAPRIGVRARQVDRPSFGIWLINRLEGLLQSPEPIYMPLKNGISA